MTEITFESLTKSEKQVVNAYIDQMIIKLIKIQPELTKSNFNRKTMIAFALKTFKNNAVELYHNTKNQYYDTTIAELIRISMLGDPEKRPIVNAFNTFFRNKLKCPNVPALFLGNLLTSRDKAKEMKFLHINDIDQTICNSYDLKQKVIKVLANSYYGAFGSTSFHFFNKLLGPSITYQGQQIIITAILGYEGSLGDNFFFDNFEEMALYIDNILSEPSGDAFNDDYIFDTDYIITDELIKKRILTKCTFDPTDTHLAYLEMTVESATLDQRYKLYFKNNMMEFLKQETFKDIIRENLVTDNFPDVNHVPENIKEPLEIITAYVNHYVFYAHQYPNKTEKVNNLYRKIVILSDTDSTFLYAGAFLEFLCDICNIDRSKLNINERASLVSIFTYFATVYIEKAFEILTRNCNVLEEDRKIITMKSEFHYSRIILTKNKKSYAGLILSQEGKVLNEPKFDIKGIQIKKTSTPRPAREFFGKILETDMLSATHIQSKAIYTEFFKFEQTIRKSIMDSLEVKFLKPGVIKSIRAYKIPERIQSVRALRMWNAIYPQQPIPESSSIRILEFKSMPMEDIAEVLPEWIIERVRSVFEEFPEMEQYGFESLGIPFGSTTFPEEFVPMIDIDLTINNIIKKGNILLHCVGYELVTSGPKYEAASNILTF